MDKQNLKTFSEKLNVSAGVMTLGCAGVLMASAITTPGPVTMTKTDVVATGIAVAVSAGLIGYTGYKYGSNSDDTLKRLKQLEGGK